MPGGILHGLILLQEKIIVSPTKQQVSSAAAGCLVLFLEMWSANVEWGVGKSLKKDKPKKHAYSSENMVSDMDSVLVAVFSE